MNQPRTIGLPRNKPALRVKLVLGLLLAGLASWWPATPAQAAIPDSITLTVKQTFTTTGLSAPPSTVFKYRLTPLAPGNPLPPGSGSGAYNFTIKGTGDVPVGPFTFSQAGVYTYQLDQVTPNRPDYTYDQQSYTLKIYVDPHPSIPIAVVAFKQDTTKASELAYKHAYYPPAEVENIPVVAADPPIDLAIKGKPGKDATFVFQLIAQDPANPMPPGSTRGIKAIEITGAGKGGFGTWTYTKPGTYIYKVVQINKGLAGYTYDTTVYTITDTVTVVGGELVIERRITDQSGATWAVLAFTNVYSLDKDSTTEPDPSSPPPNLNDQGAEDDQSLNDGRPKLPFTGANLLPALGTALASLTAGWLLLAAKRRREGAPPRHQVN